MPKKPIIQYIDLHGLGCALSADTPSQILRREGYANVRSIRPATSKDVAWVKAMGGYVPDGCTADEPAKETT